MDCLNGLEALRKLSNGMLHDSQIISVTAIALLPSIEEQRTLSSVLFVCQVTLTHWLEQQDHPYITRRTLRQRFSVETSDHPHKYA